MAIPDWFRPILGTEIPADGETAFAHGCQIRRDGDILRSLDSSSQSQAQTRDTFGFKWKKRDTYEGALATALHDWLIERYGDVAQAPWLTDHGDNPVFLDAGCGAGLSVLMLWAKALPRFRFIGADISSAIDVARTRFQEQGLDGTFLQADLQKLPLPPESVDIIFSEGVLHHTDDTGQALASVSRYLKPGGRILFYVYRKKSPIREFTDDYIRHQLSDLTAVEAWEALMPLTLLGKALGELNVEVDVPDSIDLIGIPAGRINLQRLFYWHVAKACYRPEMTDEEMNHVNYDWYTPRNAHRHTIDEVRSWCQSLNLIIERAREEEAGITVIARKAGSAC